MAAVASSLALYRGQRAPAGSLPSSSRARAIRAPRSFVLQDGHQPAPVTGSIAFHQARDTVTEKGGLVMRDRGNDPVTASYAAAGLAPATQYPPGWLRWRRCAATSSSTRA